MAIKYLASKRITGTNAERTAESLPSGTYAGWKEVARTTLGSANANIVVSSIPDKRYYMILNDLRSSSAINAIGRVGNSTLDTGSNYAERQNSNGGTDYTDLDDQSGASQYGTLSGNAGFGVEYIANLSSQEKLGLGHVIKQNTAGSGNAPDRFETVWKWANTSNVINILEKRTSVNTYNTGAEVVVLGYDPADTNTTDFWEELASVELSSAGSELSSGTFTAKKYLWIQAYVKGDGSSTPNLRVQVNGDTGSNYAERQSSNGGSDGTGASQDHFPASNGGKFGNFSNMFVINNASNEKLFIVHGVSVDTSGAGTAPVRREIAGKWANTSNQITSIKIYKSTGGNYQSGSVIKVWGSD